jgi:hypothetical protein
VTFYFIGSLGSKLPRRVFVPDETGKTKQEDGEKS